MTIFFRQLFFFIISAKVFSILSGLSYVFRHPINGPYILAETRGGGIAQEIHDAATATLCAHSHIDLGHGLINNIDIKAKKFTCKGTVQQVFICLRPPPPRQPHTSPPLTHCIRVYSILIHTGKGGRGESQPERRLEGQQFTKLGRKYQHD